MPQKHQNHATLKMSLFEWFFNPFKKVKQSHSLIIGLLIFVCISITGHYAKLYFPGIIDCLTINILDTNESYSIQSLFLQLLISWLVLSMVFCFASIKWPFTKDSIKPTYFLKLLNATALSRYPYLVLTLFLTYIQLRHPTLLDVDHAKGLTFRPTAKTLLFSSFVFLCFIWQFITYYYVFNIASPYSSWKHALAFILSLVVAEFLSIHIIGFIF